MAPDTVLTVRSWLQSRWQVCVPDGWLEACVEWLQQEADGRPLTLAHVQQQALEQWLQTDLRSLGISSLPATVCEAVKTELQGNICVQLDSLKDVSQPAYTQLQRLRGSERANDQIGAVTQATQRPWEAAPTRMLMLQVTDGVRSVEAMEYKPIPQLNSSLPPGTKLLLRGPIACRLGVLLLQAQNVQVLGGEVEELLHTNSQESVLCRTLGMPEPTPDVAAAPSEDEAVERGGHQGAVEGPEEDMLDLDDLDDLELMASLDNVTEGSVDSGYRSASMVSVATSRPSQHQISSLMEDRLEEGSRRVVPAQEGVFLGDEDDDIPLEELDLVLSQHIPLPEPQGYEDPPSTPQSSTTTSSKNTAPSSTAMRSTVHAPSPESPSRLLDSTFGHMASTTHAWNQDNTSRPSGGPHSAVRSTTYASNSMNAQQLSVGPHGEKLSSLANAHRRTEDTSGSIRSTSPSPSVANAQRLAEGTRSSMRSTAYTLSPDTVQEQSADGVQQGSRNDSTKNLPMTSAKHVPNSSEHAPLRAGVGRSDDVTHAEAGAVVSWDSPPFSYLCNLRRDVSREAHAHAFVVTLNGTIRSAGGRWSLDVCISDGSAYVDVELGDTLLAKLIGFSAAESRALKRSPEGGLRAQAGIQQCQRALVDMCGIMTIQTDPQRARPLVVEVRSITQSDCQALQQRVEARRGHRC